MNDPDETPSFKDIAEWSSSIVGYWKHLAAKLGLPVEKIQNIAKSLALYPSVEEQALQMLEEWRETGNATYRKMAEALRTLEKGSLANTICPTQLTPSCIDRDDHELEQNAASSRRSPPPHSERARDSRRFPDRHEHALQQLHETKGETRRGVQLYADEPVSDNTVTVDGDFMSKLAEFSQSVGIILGRSQDGTSCVGTAFRVGDHFVMTNSHVAQGVLEFFHLRRKSVTVSFNYRTPDRQAEDLVEVYLHPDRPVMRASPMAELDAAVLQLDIQSMPPDYRLPPPLGELHGDASCSSTLYFIAHDRNFNRCNRVINLKCPVVKCDALPQEFVQRYGLSDPRGTLLNSPLRQGSSGSPGFDENARLVVMYTKGIPDGMNPVVEQAVNIQAIKERMQAEFQSELARHLFPEPAVEMS